MLPLYITVHIVCSNLFLNQKRSAMLKCVDIANRNRLFATKLDVSCRNESDAYTRAKFLTFVSIVNLVQLIIADTRKDPSGSENR